MNSCDQFHKFHHSIKLSHNYQRIDHMHEMFSSNKLIHRMKQISIFCENFSRFSFSQGSDVELSIKRTENPRYFIFLKVYLWKSSGIFELLDRLILFSFLIGCKYILSPLLPKRKKISKLLNAMENISCTNTKWSIFNPHQPAKFFVKSRVECNNVGKRNTWKGNKYRHHEFIPFPCYAMRELLINTFVHFFSL